MICAGIPVLRPLYRRVTGTLSSAGLSKSGHTDGYFKHGTGNDTQSANIKLGDLSSTSKSVNSSTHHGSGSDKESFPDAHPKLGIKGTTTVTYIKGDNHSDEEILGWEYRQSTGGGRHGGIQVREHVDVSVEETGSAGKERGDRDGASAAEMV
jgi:hypothetical protein